MLPAALLFCAGQRDSLVSLLVTTENAILEIVLSCDLNKCQK